MCGEHLHLPDEYSALEGSSPHVRGALTIQRPQFASLGIIPACAGSTSGTSRTRSTRRDHPRMCGEHDYPEPLHHHRSGSSPHVRGARVEQTFHTNGNGIIPACAGSTFLSTNFGYFIGDHPRMCGEHRFPRNRANVARGSSPHVRGALTVLGRATPARGIIPACAGSTR